MNIQKQSKKDPTKGLIMKLLKRRISGLATIAFLSMIVACSNQDTGPAQAEQVLIAGANNTIEAFQPFWPDPVIPLSDECCVDPGAISLCWWQDANRDGVSCHASSDCPNNTDCVKTGLPGLDSPDGSGLCACESDDDCGDDGVCVIEEGKTDGVCGPSYCNGYRVCSCFGGCINATFGDYDTPEEKCAATSGAIYCCDGVYPEIPGTDLTGYCSNSAACGGDACDSDDDCPDDSNACTDEWCDEVSGGCEQEFNTVPCDDSDECTINDTCALGECEGAVRDCDDSNPCTDDSCNPATGCVHTNNTDPCDDDDACTVDDTCSGGVCTGDPRDCTDGNICTDDDCDSETGCVYVNNTDPCDDSDECTENDACSGGTCVGDILDCDDSNECTDDDCDPETPGGCVYTNNTDPCSDSDECTSGDQCAGGSCVPGSIVDCDDSNVCTNDDCDTESGCQYVNNTVPCSDGDLCTEGDACSGGSCVPGTEKDCDDSNGCTTDSCNILGNCVNTAIPDCCEDDGDCTEDLCGASFPDSQCQVTFCDLAAVPAPECTCDPTYGFDHTLSCDLDSELYPENCYSGSCDINGICQPEDVGDAANDRCRQAFQAGDPNSIDTGAASYLGSFTNSADPQPALTTTGSTDSECAKDNYQSVGGYCLEDNGIMDPGNNMGFSGNDVVYVFQYQNNSAGQYDIYQYLVKVEADFDVAVYIMTDIDVADDCPEGASTDPEGSWNANSAPCQVLDDPFDQVIFEDNCADITALYAKECCNPIGDQTVDCTGTTGTEPTDYFWCRRFYPEGCCAYTENERCDLTCDGYWEYPDDVTDCSFEQGTYTDDIAAALVSPRGAADASTHYAFIFVDGARGGTGNFYLSVERKLVEGAGASPCERENDNMKFIDITNASATGTTYLGNLDYAVNSMHSAMGTGLPCDGYNCVQEWSGAGSCHEVPGSSPASTEFYPGQVFYRIMRPTGTGSQTYCIQTDEDPANMADLTITVKGETPDTTYFPICAYVIGFGMMGGELGCVHNNTVVGSDLTNHAPTGKDIVVEFTATENTDYLIEVSNYKKYDSHCAAVSPAVGCDYALTVTAAECPFLCSDPLKTLKGTHTIDSASPGSKNGSSSLTAGDASTYSCASGLSIYYDEVWKIENTTETAQTATVTATPTNAWNLALCLYDCANTKIACYNSKGAGAGASFKETFNREVAAGEEYYVVVETNTFGGTPHNYSLTTTW